MITCISGSPELAAVLNATPLTAEDAAETPRDWPSIWVAGETYELDRELCTDTLAVLADGTAAAAWSPRGEYCKGSHRTGPDSQRAHWCVADTDSWSLGDARGVTRDWRSVTVWDANGHSDTTVHDTLDEAKAAFTSESEEMQPHYDDGKPVVDADTVRELLAADERAVLAMYDDDPRWLSVDDSESEAAVGGGWTVLERSELIDEIGETPTDDEIDDYLSKLQDTVDDHSMRGNPRYRLN